MLRVNVQLKFSEEEVFQYFKDNGYSDKLPYRKLTEDELKGMSANHVSYFENARKSTFENIVSNELGKHLKRMVLDPKGYEREKKIDDIIN